MINAKQNLKEIIFLLFLFLSATGMAQQKARLLVFCKTAGYHHASIEVGKLAILQLGKENGFEVDTTSKADLFTRKGLKKYQAIVFLSTTEDVLNAEQQTAFQQYIQAGGGFAGVHAATDTEFDWPWYGNLVGAYFGKHPEQQEAVLHVVDKNNIATSHLPDQWKRKDEWYNFKWMTKEPLNVLITLDEHSYDPGQGNMGDYHPMSWYHDFDGGRSFYTGLGHTDESYSDPLFLKHLLGGLQYALGIKKMK